MTKKRMNVRNGFITVTCLLLLITGFLSNYQISKAESMFVLYGATTHSIQRKRYDSIC